MKELDINKFSNHLDLLKITLKEIEDSLKKISLTFPLHKNERIEWGIRLPIFLNSFYKFIFNKQKLPTQEEFYNYYISENKTIDLLKLTPDEKLGVKGRIFRTYPSLVRDFHFSKLLSKRKNNYEVIYNTNLDVQEGIDLLIKKGTENIAINLYTNTKRAIEARKKKGNRHTVYSNIKYIDLPVNFKGSFKLGDFFLYGNDDADNLDKLL